jgi:KDO2-lipid IV(A) lauroyltransferase
MADKILFFFLHGSITFLSWWPMWLLYRLSDLLYLAIYHLWAYRKPVVQQNLQLAFPELGAAEREKMEKSFYRFFCDLLVEGLKVYTISDRELKRRVVLTENGFAKKIKSQQKGALLWASHYGNFEWMMARLDLEAREQEIPTSAVYSPFKRPAFERLMKRLRERRGLQMIPMQKAMKAAISWLSEPGMFGMIGDQAPHHGLKLYFTRFLNQATAFHLTIAKIVLRTESLVFFVDIRRPKRGYYELTLQEIPLQDFLPESKSNIRALTEAYASRLEEVIQQNPPFWLWSHRRWKHPLRPGDERSPSLSPP